MALATSALRCLPAVKAVSISSLSSGRALSTQCPNSIQKLRQLFAECHAHEETKEMPSRFKLEVAKATQDNSKIAPEGLDCILSNFGAADHLSQSEKDAIFTEFGESGAIPKHHFLQMIYTEADSGVHISNLKQL